MKQILFLCLLLVACTPAWPQSTSLADESMVVRFDTMPAEGILLNTGWKFHSGDNPAWADPGLDDRNWADFTPTLPPRKLPQYALAGIGWVRLHLRLSERIQQQALFLIEDQFMASEIYLNGKLIRRYGVVSRQPEQVSPARLDYFNALELPTDGKTDQVLAIRFSTWPPLTRFSDYVVPYTFKYILVNKPQLLERFAEWLPLPVMFAVLTAVFLLLFMLHLAFWRYNPDRHANLYFAFYALAEALAFCSGVTLWHDSSVQIYLVLSLVMFFFFQLGNVFCVRALHALFAIPAGWTYRLIWLAFLVCQFLFLAIPSGFWSFGGFMLLVMFEQVRLTLLALRQHRRGAIIVATGFACALLLMASLVGLNYVGLLTYSLYLFIAFSFVLAAPAIGISLFLAREFALDSQLLQIKLVQVQDLSTKTIAQEQEKQQLLASQNETLEQQVAERTAQLQQSLDNLKATQTQLIQSEKMASLGELTAGIAHEIQNPLNFVNNFSEVSTELVDELSEEQQKAERTVDLEADLLADLKDNLHKILHHGKRASNIVKNMLEHARTSPGDKQPTDLNTLAEEYLRLAYHGLRAKNHNFNCELETRFDSCLGKVDVIPQDISRVFLNLFTNAFYAVWERKKQQKSDYSPVVSVCTQCAGAQVMIHVRDNGVGIPPESKQKIFLPFFTTKPSGEGTGLGLSLSYDIITKGHNGTLTVDSWPEKGTEFTICLPIVKKTSMSQVTNVPVT